MTLDEYIKQATDELLNFKTMWEENNKENPKQWPMEMGEEDWGEQELGSRF